MPSASLAVGTSSGRRTTISFSPEFLTECVKILDEDPSTLVAGTRCGLIERDGSPVPFNTELGKFVTSYGEQIPAPTRPVRCVVVSERVTRFRSVLFDVHGPDEGKYIFGLIRSDALAATPLNQGYIGGDKVLLGRLSLAGRFRRSQGSAVLQEVSPGTSRSIRTRHLVGTYPPCEAAMRPNADLILFPLAYQVGGYFRRDPRCGHASRREGRCVAIVVEKVADVGIGRITAMPTRIRGGDRGSLNFLGRP